MKRKVGMVMKSMKKLQEEEGLAIPIKEEIQEVIKGMKNNEALGQDGVSRTTEVW